jgi:hypothetical protein
MPARPRVGSPSFTRIETSDVEKLAKGKSTMNVTHFEAEVRQLLGRLSARSGADQPSVDTAWLVLEAANDLGDGAAVEACRRVIDADLNGGCASQSDLQLIFDYFR